MATVTWHAQAGFLASSNLQSIVSRACDRHNITYDIKKVNGLVFQNYRIEMHGDRDAIRRARQDIRRMAQEQNLL